MSAKPIVAATDGSAESLRAVDWAAREAVLRGATLRVVSAVALPPRMIGARAMSGHEAVAGTLREQRDEALAAAAERAAKAGPGLLVTADQLEGAPAQAVTETGSGALMLVVGSRGAGAFAAMILGSVSRYVATHASCPVVIVREESRMAHQHIGIGIGDQEHCGPPLAFALEEAAARKASLIAVHSWEMPESDISRAGEVFLAPGIQAIRDQAATRLENLLDGWRDKYPGVSFSHEVVHGHPGRALVGLSARTDLVVLGRQAAYHGPGSVLHAVLSHAHGPVATVPY
jgi:nucleotide-binding universal stress UspA family protein